MLSIQWRSISCCDSHAYLDNKFFFNRALIVDSEKMLSFNLKLFKLPLLFQLSPLFCSLISDFTSILYTPLAITRDTSVRKNIRRSKPARFLPQLRDVLVRLPALRVSMPVRAACVGGMRVTCVRACGFTRAFRVCLCVWSLVSTKNIYNILNSSDRYVDSWFKNLKLIELYSTILLRGWGGVRRAYGRE